MKRFLALTSLAVIIPLAAQDKKPAPAKPDRAAEARAALNEAKQDARNKERIKEAEAAVKKALKNNEAAKTGIDRLKKTDDAPEKKDAKATLEKVKDSVDKNNMKELEALLKEATEDIREQARAYQEKRRQEGKTNPASSAPAPAADPPPVSFDHVPPAVPMPLLKVPDFPAGPTVVARHGVICGDRDPRHPDVVLPADDPRRRMWVLTGDVRVRRPFMALDADEVDLFLKEGQTPDIAGGSKGAPSAPAVDPAGRQRRDDEPFERIIARGNVRVMFVDVNGIVKVARGGSMIYDSKTGIFLIKEWPEAELGDKLITGPEKNSVIKLSNLKAEKPDIEMNGLKWETMERRLTAEDMPHTPDKEVPKAGGLKPKAAPGTAPSPTPR